jgi:hypothetical protein
LANSQDIKDKADAVLTAKAAQDAARAAADAKRLEANALVPTELAAYQAAEVTYFTAFETASESVGLPAAESAASDAEVATQEAVEELRLAMEQFDGT